MKKMTQGVAVAIAFLLPCMAVEAAPTRVPYGLVGEWRMQLSGSAVPDTSGYVNNGVLQGGTAASYGWQDGGADLRGGKYVEVPNSPSLDFGSVNFFLAAWIRMSDTSQPLKTIIESRGSDGRGYTFAVENGNRLLLRVTDSVGTYDFRSFTSPSRPLVRNQWHHVEVELFRPNSNSLTVFFNVDGDRTGLFESTSFNLGPIPNIDQPFFIGGSSGSPSTRFNDRIDEVLAYNGTDYYAGSGSGIPYNETWVGYAPYVPTYWNDGSTRQRNNNCYNYANNKATNTFAQPGRAAGAMYSSLTCAALRQAAINDGLEPVTDNYLYYTPKTVVALVVAPYRDFHWYRFDRRDPVWSHDARWTHKPGQGAATNLDNSGREITDPRTANRGIYTDFCGFFRVWSDSVQGTGHEFIN